MEGKALITEPMALFVFLAGIVGVIFWLGEFKALKKFFHFFPPLIFCYFVPMFTTTIGITPESSPLYGWFSKNFLLPTLILLLLAANVPAILRLGPKALAIMLAGSAGMIVGAPLALFFFKSQVTPEAWQNLGALVGSWTGGSANMFALKEGFKIPDTVFAPMPIVDVVVGYGWMGVVIALAGYQEVFAERYKIDTTILKELNRRMEQTILPRLRPITIRDLAIMMGVALVVGYLCQLLGQATFDWLKPFWLATVPTVLDVLKPYVLAIILVTLAGVLLSFTPLSRLEEAGASRVGFTMLYLILTTYGAQANLAAIVKTPWYIGIGVIMIIVHVAFLYTATRLLRAPLFLFAVGSQANIGGPPTASIVAATYQPALAPVGILLGVFGGIIGTYCGIAASFLCRLIMG